MNRERLAKLADFLCTVPKEKWNFTTWWCGTAGCALGWAAHLEEFQEEGLKIVETCEGACCYGVSFNGEEGVNAAMDFFDLCRSDATSIFIEGSSQTGVHMPTPVDIAGRILDLLA